MHNGASFGKRNVQVFWWNFACWRLLIQISLWHPGLSQNHGRSGVCVRRVESEWLVTNLEKKAHLLR